MCMCVWVCGCVEVALARDSMSRSSSAESSKYLEKGSKAPCRSPCLYVALCAGSFAGEKTCLRTDRMIRPSTDKCKDKPTDRQLIDRPTGRQADRQADRQTQRVVVAAEEEEDDDEEEA